MASANFTNRVAMVTGGSHGIGAAIASLFAAAGANVIVHYRGGKEAAAALVDNIHAAGGNAIALQARLDREEEVRAMFAAARDAFGIVDTLVNNAGSYPNASLLEMSLDDWRGMFADNVDSTFLCTRIAAEGMKNAGGGAIVNMSSISAFSPGPDHAHYNSAKAAIVMFTRSAALELGPMNIRVNGVAPGVVYRDGIGEAWPDGVKRFTDASPLGQLVQPEDVAQACLFLASDLAARITGATLPIDSGVLAAPVY